MRKGLIAAALGLAAAAACAGGEADEPRVAFQSDGSGRWALYAVRPDGSDLRRMTDIPGGFVGLAVWSPDRDRLFIPVETTRTAYAVVVDARTGDRRRLHVHSVGGASWAPDASRIAVAAERGIVVVDADGSNRRQLTFNPSDFDPAWSPDGDRIAFASGDELFTVGLGGGPRLVARVAGEDVWAPGWSHDGRWIAFSRSDLDRGTAPLEIVHPDGTGRRQVARDADQAAWSPRERTIVFVHAGDVYRVDTDNGRRTRLTFDGPDWSLEPSPSWSPDGELLAFIRPRLAKGIRDPSPPMDIWAMNADGSRKHPVTRAFPTGGTNAFPAWVAGEPKGTEVRSPVNLVQLRPRRILRTRPPVGGLTAEGSTAVVVQGLGSATEFDNPPGPLLLWDAKTGSTRRIPVRACGTATRPMQVGRRVAYVCNNSAVDLLDWEIRIGTRTVAHLRATHLVGTRFASRLLQGVAAGDTVLAFAVGERPKATSRGFSPLRTTVWRIDRTRPRRIAAFAREARVVDADARVALVHEGRVVVVDARTGKVLQRLVFRRNDLRDVELDGTRLVALLRDRLAVYDASTGRLRAERRLPPDLGRPRFVAGVQGDLAAYVAGLAVHVLRLPGGPEIVVDLRTAAGPVLARLTHAGLFYSYTDPRRLPAGRLAFVPRAALERALARAG